MNLSLCFNPDNGACTSKKQLFNRYCLCILHMIVFVHLAPGPDVLSAGFSSNGDVLYICSV